MTYLPKYAAPHSPIITCLSPESVSLAQNRIAVQSPGSLAWPLANLAIYIPFSLRSAVTIYKMFAANGATASNNFDLGIYTSDGTKIISTGSTALSGTNALQVISVTNTTISPGMFYLAMAMNGTAGTNIEISMPVARAGQTIGLLEQTSAFPLPATATFASYTRTYMPIFGFSTVPIV